MHSILKTNKRIEERVRKSIPAKGRATRNSPRIKELCSTVVMSIDVTALYPSITVELARETMLNVTRKSRLLWENVDIVTLERFLAITMTSSELRKNKIR